MRYIIYGAGAVGGSIGARLFERGHDVVLIARGPHFEAMHRHGLSRARAGPDGDASDPGRQSSRRNRLAFRRRRTADVKSQHTAGALDDLRKAAGDALVICAQNGVANERMALRRFSRVYAMMVMLPATHMQPGEVIMHASPVGGILDAGCYPAGVDPLIEQLADELRAAGFDSRADAAVMRLKYAKLIENLANTVQALCGLEANAGELVRMVRAEGIAALRAANIDFAAESEMDERRAEVMRGLPSHRGPSARRIYLAEPGARRGLDRDGLPERGGCAPGVAARRPDSIQPHVAAGVSGGDKRTGSRRKLHVAGADGAGGPRGAPGNC